MNETNGLSAITNAVASTQQSIASGVFSLVIIGICVLIGFVCFLWLYFLPTLIIRKRKKRLFWAMFIANLFFGVTILGWIICLIVALSVSPESGPAIKAELG
jgi:hypothetical protein